MRNLYLFDLDETLIVGLGPWISSMQAAVKQTFETEIEIELAQYHGMTDSGILDDLLRKNNIQFQPSQKLKCLEEFGHIYQASDKETKPLPNVKQVLFELRQQGHYLAIVTGNVQQMAQKKLALYDLNQYFEPLGIFGGQISNKREEVVVEAVKHALAIDEEIENIYVIGDTVRDIDAAKKASEILNTEIISIGVIIGHTSKEDLLNAGADHIMHELTALLKQQF